MVAQQARDQLMEALDRKPRFSLATLPTPLREAPRLSRRLGVRVLIKHDDQTGLALGGNKTRKLEYLMADVLASGCDVVVTTGGSQSNHARLSAAACRRAGVDCHLVLDRGRHPEMQGNLLLDKLFGAHVHWVESEDPAAATSCMEALARELRDAGRTPYVVPRGGSVPAGAIGYAAFVPELIAQLHDMQLEASHLYLGTGSTGTHSGVLAGFKAMQVDIKLQGISVSRPGPLQSEKVLNLTNETLRYLDLPFQATEADVNVDGAFRGPGYGVPTSASMQATDMLALDEAVILDPVYTAKVMAGLIDHARRGILQSGDVVVFLHTGGSPAIFAYSQELFGTVALERA